MGAASVQACAGRNHGVTRPHLERLVTGSRITMHSFTSPYLQKYSFRPSEEEQKSNRFKVGAGTRPQVTGALLKNQEPSAVVPPELGVCLGKRRLTLCRLPAESTYEHFTAKKKRE